MYTNKFQRWWERHGSTKAKWIPTKAQINLRETLAFLTSRIDYQCSFDSNGYCHGYSDSFGNHQGRNCCAGCAHSHGYLDGARHVIYLFNRENTTFRLISSLFNDETGFWRKGVGCILPRKYRSAICLRHNCCGSPRLPKALTRYELIVLSAICDGEQTLQEFNKYYSGQKIEISEASVGKFIQHMV